MAFAHCISGDFGHNKQMSTGAAVEFKKQFGKPSVRDCIGKYLAFQEVNKGGGAF